MERNIPTQQYDGDLSVGRDLSVGGDSQLRGNATVGHNLTVKGWLEARNIKGANKGLFTSEEALKKAYPRPEKGWWAIVGKTLPGDIYVAENGAWVPTGEQGGNPSIDCQPFLEDLSALKDRMDATEAEIETLTAAVKQAEMAVVQLSELDKETVERLKSEPRRSVMMVVDEKGRVVGVVFQFADNMEHVLTQVLHTHYVIEGGGTTAEIAHSHNHNHVNVLHRMFTNRDYLRISGMVSAYTIESAFPDGGDLASGNGIKAYFSLFEYDTSSMPSGNEWPALRWSPWQNKEAEDAFFVNFAIKEKANNSFVKHLQETYDREIASLKSADKEHLEIIDGLISTDVDMEQRLKAVEQEIPKIGPMEQRVSDLIEGCTMRFDGFASLGEVEEISVERPLSIRFHTGQQVFVAEYRRGAWCNNWPSRYQYMDDEGHVRANKLFLCDSALYCWNPGRNRLELVQGGGGGEMPDPNDLRRRVEILENELAQLRELLTV